MYNYDIMRTLVVCQA